MIEAPSPFEILKSLGLANWSALSVGWERGWVSKANLTDYATSRLESDVNDSDLASLVALASPERLNAAEIADRLKQVAIKETDESALDKWRLARLLELQATYLDWEEKVTRLEELGAEFGYPPDMRLCSRYVTSEQENLVDPLNAMEDVICALKDRLGAR